MNLLKRQPLYQQKSDDDKNDNLADSDEHLNGEDENGNPEKTQEDKEKNAKAEVKEKKEPEIIRVIPSYNISNFISENNKALNAASNTKVNET